MTTVQSGAFVVEKNGKSEVVYTPLPHQTRFHESKARYTLMSGGRGSGKSLAMRMEALMMAMMIPGFRALILRRSAPELKKSHLMELPMELAKIGLPRSAYHITDMVVRIPGNHSLVQFGHVEDEHALTKWLSSQWSAVFMDELSTFTYTQMTWLLTSLRSTIPGFVPYFKAGTNPVGPGAGFVRDLWITKDAAQNPEQYPGYNPDDYYNIHCNLDDNPHLNPVEYAKVFEGIPSQAIRDALRHGIWSIEGQAFPEWAPKRDDKPWHVINALPTYKGQPLLSVPGIEVFRSIDWGYSDYGCAHWYACLFDGSIVVFDEMLFKGLLPHEVAEDMRRRSEGMRVRYTVADPAMWAEHEGPSIAEHFELAGVPMIEGDRQRKPGWVCVHNWLQEEKNDGLNVRPALQVVGPNCKYLVRTLPNMVMDEKDVEDIKTRSVEDHGVDSLRYGLMSRPSASRIPQTEAPHLRTFRSLFRRDTRRSRLGSEAVHG